MWQEIWDKPENSVSYMDIEKQTRQQRGLPAMSEDQVSAIAKGFDNEDKDYASRERTGATGGYNRKEAAAAIRRRAISEIQKRPQLSRGGPGANGGVSQPGSAGGNSGNSGGVVRDPVAYVGEQAGPEDLARMAQPTREQQVAQAAVTDAEISEFLDYEQADSERYGERWGTRGLGGPHRLGQIRRWLLGGARGASVVAGSRLPVTEGLPHLYETVGDTGGAEKLVVGSRLSLDTGDQVEILGA